MPVFDDALSIVRIMCPSAGTVGTAFKHVSGHLLTSDSAVSSCSEVLVALPSGYRVEAQVVARDPYSDLAILLPRQKIPGRALTFAKDPNLQVGVPTASWGFPAGYDGNSALLSIGYIAGMTRLSVNKEREVTKLIIGVNYNSGLSGSPLVDKAGAVVGVVSGMLSPLSDAASSGLRALKNERGSSFVWQQENGAKITLSNSQVVAMILEELQMRMNYLAGIATPLQELREFMAKNGVDL